MTYTSLIDDSFARADTTAGSGANSTTGVGNGWTDLLGNVYCLQASVGGLTRSLPTGLKGAKSPLYQAASAQIVNGRVRIYANLAGTRNRGGVFRMTTARGIGNGYFAGVTSNSAIYISKLVDDLELPLLTEETPTYLQPGNFVLEATCQQDGPGRTRLSVSIFDPANLDNPVATRHCFDEERSLQNAAGIMGVSSSTHGFDAARVVLYAAS